MTYSYERVSTEHQDERRQEMCLRNIHIDRRYVDKLSGKNKDRPKLKMLLGDIRQGDHVYCESISRLGRNVDDLRSLTQEFINKGATIHFVKEDISTGGMYKFLLTVLGAVAEMERELIAERTSEGLAKARIYGTLSGRPIGRPPAILPKDFEKYYIRWLNKEITKVEFAKLLNVSRGTIYHWIRQYETERETGAKPLKK